MIEYLKEIAATIQLSRQNIVSNGVQQIHGHDVPDLGSLLTAFAEELDRLDPREFAPVARHDFVILRIAMRNWAKGNIGNGEKPAEDADSISQLLDHFTGVGSGVALRDFAFVTNPDVKAIVVRDYGELVLRAFPDRAWKSTVILSGSILEAVLHDVMTKDPAATTTAMGSAKAPNKPGGGGKKDITLDDYVNQWTLNDLIKVACDIGLLPMNDEKAIHLVLREYRNLVHPRKEVSMGVSISEGHATASKGMLDICLDELT